MCGAVSSCSSQANTSRITTACSTPATAGTTWPCRSRSTDQGENNEDQRCPAARPFHSPPGEPRPGAHLGQGERASPRGATRRASDVRLRGAVRRWHPAYLVLLPVEPHADETEGRLGEWFLR